MLFRVAAGCKNGWPKELVCVSQKIIGKTTVTATKPVAITKTIMTASIIDSPVDTCIYVNIHMSLYDFRQ